jgi:hypothetical protein
MFTHTRTPILVRDPQRGFMCVVEFTAADIESLTDKLVELELTESERQALRTIVALGVGADGGPGTDSGDDEVSGFDYEPVTLERGVADFRALSIRIGRPSNSSPTHQSADGILPTGETVQF